MNECDRVIVHIDVDAFYAQVEELKQPSLAARPMGVTQKHIVVTCNYPARSRGVTKLMTIKDALNRCPELITIKGEDLTPYRAANKALLAVLRRYGTVQKGGLDEALIDITEQVTERLLDTSHGEWKGKMYGQDIESKGWPRLRCGATIADEMRRVVRVETGLRTSAGIACNPLLAKLASSVHKPDDQTIVLPSHAAAFVENLPVSAIPGVGTRLASTLRTQFGATRVHHLRSIKMETLERAVGNRQAVMLAAACWGRDPSPVTESSLPKTIGVEDSFPKSSSSITACTTFITSKLTSLAADLFDRVNEENKENGRIPTRLVLTWRVAGDAGDASPVWKRRTASCEFPRTIEEMVDSAMRLLRASAKSYPELTLLGLSASGFKVISATAETSQRAITNFLSVLPAATDKNLPCLNAPEPKNCVIHCDVDCFYCAVERVDDPLCIGRPIAVSQFHGGGFVSVSYEAREAGIRCGDGAGGGGRVGVQHLAEMGARSVKDCLAACPGLVIKPMRPQRYRQMSDAILELFQSVLQSESIEKYAIEKSSCDDFYVKIWMADNFSNLTLLEQATVVPADSGDITMDLKLGAVVANKMKSALKQWYGMTASCGVARNKLLARLASPCGKPDGLTVVSDAGVLDFIGSIAVTDVPGLQGAFGAAVAKKFCWVEDLRQCSRSELIRSYGQVKGKFLADLAYGIDDRAVGNTEHGNSSSSSSMKSVSTERSFEPRSLDGSAELTALLESLAVGLLERVKEKKVLWGEKKVESLTVGGRKGYDVTKSCKGSVPQQVVAWCSAMERKDYGIHEASRALVRETLSRLRQLFGRNEKVTRVSLTLRFDCQSVQHHRTAGLLALPDMSVKACKATGSVEKTPVTYRNKHASEVERFFSNANDVCATMLAPSTDQDEALAYKLQREEVMLARGKTSETRSLQTAVGKRRISKTSNVLESFVIRKKSC